MNTTRRSFIRNTTAVLAGAAIAPTLVAAEAKKRSLKKAVMWNTIGYPGTVLEKLKALKAAGFDGFEAESHMNQDEVMRALDETGLKCASVCGKYHWGKPLSSPDEKVRTEGIDALKQTLRDAKRYGAKSILLVPGTARNNVVTFQECWDRSIAGIKQVLPVCEETGVKIAIENVWNDFLMKPQQAKDYLEAINSPWVAWHFDIGNHVRFGPSEEWIKVLGKRIVNLHFKEYSNEVGADGKPKGFNVKFLEGSNHWPEIMAEIDKIGYDGWAITEMPGGQTKDAESLKDFSSRLDRILAS